MNYIYIYIAVSVSYIFNISGVHVSVSVSCPVSVSVFHSATLPWCFVSSSVFMVWSVGDMLRFRNLSSLNFPWFCFLFIYFGRDFLGGLIFHWFISSWISLIQLGLVSIEPILVFSISELILSKFSFLCFFPDFIH